MEEESAPPHTRSEQNNADTEKYGIRIAFPIDLYDRRKNSFVALKDVISLRLLMVLSGVLLLSMSVIILSDRKFYHQGANDTKRS